MSEEMETFERWYERETKRMQDELLAEFRRPPKQPPTAKIRRAINALNERLTYDPKDN